MRAKAGILLIISLLFLVGAVGALDASVINPPSKDWVIANGIDQSTITVSVQNTVGPINGATVFFSVNNSIYGTMSPASVTTGPTGLATSTFTVKKKSGTAIITANISYDDGGIPVFVTKTVSQNIDHDSPYYDISISPPLFTYSEQGTVTSQVPFKVSIYDKWGNPIDNRNPLYIHNIGLHVSSALSPDDSYFVGNFTGNGTQDIFLPLDSNGTLSVKVKLTSKSGSNKILMDNFEGKISPQIAWITVMAVNIPYSMTANILPAGELPANNNAKFTIDYYLYDKYANPIGNCSILISTNLTGETTQTEHFSDTNGLIRFYYGPKTSILTSNITAIAKDNASVTKNLIAKFVSSGVGTNLILVISPETMASRDSDPSTTREARVVATLTDAWGYPVTGKDVTFTMSNIITAPYNKTVDPSFDSGPVSLIKNITTDSNGNAIITFYSGAFVTGGSDYSDGATGSCEVVATDGTLTSNSVHLEWKNFAYLSVAVNVTPQTVHVNDTIDVTIRITGDGYKMVQNPITVVLDMDTTSNLNAQAAGDKTNVGGNGLPRFDNSKTAAKTFVGSLSSQDQVGLVTYGYYPNNQYWELISNASYNHNNVNMSIDSLVNQGGLNVSIRDSVDAAVTRITTNPLRPAEEVAAIITFGDSSYHSSDFAPMVQETWTTNNIRIYSVLYVSSFNNCNGNYANDLTALTNAAHGKFYCVESLDDAISAFGDIKQNLSTIAGVNTSMDLNFEQVSYVTNGTTNFGNDTVSYVPIGPFVNHTKSNVDSAGRTSIIWTDGNQSVVNQTDDWNDDFNLNFAIGTIHIKETWETTFRLRVNKEGVIDLFGPGSSISFNGGTGSLNLPATYIISLNDTISLGLQTGTLSVTNLEPDDYSKYYNNNVPMKWNLNYIGFDTVTETYWYSFRTQPFVEFGGTPGIGNGTYTHSITLDVTKFPPGEYRIKVIASVPGIPPAEDSGAFTKPFENGTVSIRLK